MTKGTDALPLAAKALILCAMNDNIRVIHPLQSRREGAISAGSAALAQLVRALDCGSRGPPFKPGRRYHLPIPVYRYCAVVISSRPISAMVVASKTMISAP